MNRPIYQPRTTFSRAEIEQIRLMAQTHMNGRIAATFGSDTRTITAILTGRSALFRVVDGPVAGQRIAISSIPAVIHERRL